jgi:diguanylate cyclase (GGDEF)-like protein
MFNQESKNNQIRLLLFTLKILALFFSAIPLFQYFYDKMKALSDGYYGNLISMVIGLVIVFCVMLLWLSLTNKKMKQTSFQIFEVVIFFAMFVYAIYISGASGSSYKFLFLFIIIAYTIEYGMKSGILIGAISSVTVLSIDIIFGGTASANQFFQNDLTMSAMFVVVAWTLGFYVKLEKTHIEQLTEYANIDGLTGLYNHRYFHEFLNATCEACKKENRELSLLIFDVDYFKSYNDMYGHQKGDELLRELSVLVKSNLRAGDVFCRYGGDEFCIILPDTDKEQAGGIAQRLRNAVSQYHAEGQQYMQNSNLTISVGVSALDDETDTYAMLIDNADSALYRAKFLRRNRVEVYSSVFDQFSEFDNDKVLEENLKPLKTLITVINSRDTYTFKHVERVVDYCRLMADELELDKEQKRCLIYSAYLHDLGKINTPKEILITDKRLTDEEWEELKRHPIDSAKIISQIEGFKDAAPVALQHHEKYDGSGYPNGLSGEKISYLARILTIADSFDAMTNHRPYQKIKTFEEAYAEIDRCRGTHFDPDLAQRFIQMMKAQ